MQKVKTRAIFFDLDGTLIDISEKYYRVYRDFMLAHTRRRALSKEKFWRLKRQKQQAAALIKDTALVGEYNRFFIENIEQEKYLRFDTPFTFSISLLHDMQLQGLRVYIVTLRRKRANLLRQMKALHFMGLAIFLSPPALSFDNTSHHVLKRELIQQYAQRGDIIIGDTDTDILCGKNLDLTTVAVLSGISSYAVLKRYSPDYLVRDVRSLRKLKGQSS